MEERSLRKHTQDLIGALLFKEGFPNYPYLQDGIVEIIDKTSEYKEEGETLYPEVFITCDIDRVLEALPFCQKLEIGTGKAETRSFQDALKLCAPLSRDGWIIYLNVESVGVKFGLVSTEISELCPTFRNQVIGDLSESGDDYKIVYLQNAGNKTVYLRGKTESALICLSLTPHSGVLDENLARLAAECTNALESLYKSVTKSYLEKVIGQALATGHGNLIAVIDDSSESIGKLKQRHPDGIYLPRLVDLHDAVATSESENSREASTRNRLYSSLFRSMLNHDGMTVITTAARIVGYHIFVKPDGSENGSVVGGARTRAFEIMKSSGCFQLCYYKSQDGREQVWRNEDE